MLVTEKSMISASATFLKHEIPFHQVPCHAIDEEFYVFTTSFCIPFAKDYRFFLTIDRLRHFFDQEEHDVNFVKVMLQFESINERKKKGNKSQL